MFTAIRNKLNAMDGAGTPSWTSLVNGMPAARVGVRFESDGVLHVRDRDDAPFEVCLSEDFGQTFPVGLACGAGEVAVLSPGRFDIKTTDGVTLSFRYGGGEYYQHVIRRVVTHGRACGSRFRFGSDGKVRISGQPFHIDEPFDVELPTGVRATSDGKSRMLALSGSLLGVQGYSFLGRNGWRECSNPVREWSFGRVLNSESSDSVELFGTVKLYSNGNVELAGTQAWSPRSEIEACHVDPSGRGALLIKRRQGSDVLEIYEDDFLTPSAKAVYQPQSVVGKDGKTLYDAWQFAASATTLPNGYPGQKPLRTAALGLATAGVASSLFVPASASIFCSAFGVAVVAFAAVRSFKLIWG